MSKNYAKVNRKQHPYQSHHLYHSIREDMITSLLNTFVSVEVTTEVVEFRLPTINRDFGQVFGGKIINANNFQSKLQFKNGSDNQ